MKHFSAFLLVFAMLCWGTYAQPVQPQDGLNRYVEFLSRSSEVLTARFKMLQAYQEDVSLYQKRPTGSLRLSSSGPLEEFYYQKALEGGGLTAIEKQRMNAAARTIWELVNQVDQTGKALETYVRLNSYQSDHFKQSDFYLAEMQSLFERFSKAKTDFYQQILVLYRRHQPLVSTDAYLVMEKEMEQAIINEQQLLDRLPFYLKEESVAEWPSETVQEHMLAAEKLIQNFGKTQPKIAYPASDMVNSFRSALKEMQAIKRRAVDDHNFAARQSSQHGNAVYVWLMNEYNQDLLAMHKSFISYAKPAKRMLDYPAFSPVFKIEPDAPAAQTRLEARTFTDKPLIAFTTKRAAAPASAEAIRTLNGYVDFINEGLRQMHLLQILLRNYQQSAEYHRDPVRSRRSAGLIYSHQDYKVPLSAYQLLTHADAFIPEPYRPSVAGQAQVLLAILKEMDELSIELVTYTKDKQYLQDQLRRSDAILDRYAYLFDIFDKKKEQLYIDIRRIHETYPNASPSSSWFVSGSALLHTMDDGKNVLFGIRAWLRGEAGNIPPMEKLEAGARQLIADEYKNMKGLHRYGRSNGLCPYTPYEDLAENSIRFAEKARNVKPVSSVTASHPYESFYYFYNNELVYPYNKFVELANAGLLKMVNQPDVFAFRRSQEVMLPVAPVRKARNRDEEVVISLGNDETPGVEKDKKRTHVAQERPKALRDTVYVERVRVDTVYLDRPSDQREVSRSLNGFAANNMVLLLDVSASMNSPYKLPLLKRSIKSLLTLLRPEDQISIVLYSGKARVVLKPTSGAKSAEIARMIDLLQSSGDTDGNEGIRLAYKVANKEYIRAGNNRIVLATDGEFPVSDEVMQMIGQNARQDVHLSVFTFGRNQHTGQKLRKLSQLGEGTYAHVTEESADLQLILEAQAKKQAVR